MTAYVVAEVDVTDPEAIKDYQKDVPAVIEAFGGRYLARGGEIRPQEGNWEPTRLVIVEFPSLEIAEKFYNSEEYADLKALRIKASNSRLVLVDGL